MAKENLIFMFGDDSFSMSQELKRWKKAFIQKYGGDMNLEEMDGSKVSTNEILSTIAALPFLAEKRLVIVKDFLDSQKADAKKDLANGLEKLPDHTVLVLAEQKDPDKRSSLTKFLNKEATVRIFNLPQGAQLNTWAIRRAESYGGRMDQRSAAYLASQVGNQLWRLDSEVHKLALYAGENPISIEMIDELVNGSIEQSIFTLTDQLAHKDHAGALRTLRQLQEQGHEGPFLFSMIARQFRLMLEMKALAEQRMTPNIIAQRMKVHPFVAKKTLPYCRNFTYGQLRGALAKLLEIDRRLKTGQIHLRPREEEQYLLAIERVLLAK